MKLETLRENILVPSPLENVSVNTFESEKAVELSIRVDDGQCSDISSVAGDDVDQISPLWWKKLGYP